jgi:uncharacterized protein GlcG (DUF336 family)
MHNKLVQGAITAVLAVSASGAWAACSDIPRNALVNAINAAEAAGKSTGGYNLKMWATVVDETGKVCHVATSGNPGSLAGNSEWLASRVISAQKANTANSLSLDGYAISTANLYSPTQPGGSLFGLQHSNPVDASQAYLGNPANYGTNNDPLKNKRIGGVNVFGGGLALYKNSKKVGALGVSGDTSCRDHAYAWQIRGALGMHPVSPQTVGITTVNMDASGKLQTPIPDAAKGDEMIIGSPNSGSYWNYWSQPACPNSDVAISAANGTLKAAP